MGKPIPIKGKHRFLDMMSNSTSLETKANAARWYAEMMIDLFLSDELKEAIGKEKFYKMSLKEKIDGIKIMFDEKIIDALRLIKDFGDKGSHYNPDYQLRPEDVDKVTSMAVGLFSLILIDHLKKEDLSKTYNRAVILSTLYPSVREEVLFELVDFKSIKSELDYGIFHKYILACVKNGNTNKAKRRLKTLRKKGVIEKSFFQYELKSIQAISTGITKGELPIPKTSADCKRNFCNVLADLDESEKLENRRLIEIIDKLLEQVEPSDMREFIPNVKYLV